MFSNLIGKSSLTRKLDAPDSDSQAINEPISSTLAQDTPTISYRSLGKRTRSHYNTTNPQFLKVLARTKAQKTEHQRTSPLEKRKKRRPLLTELFNPAKDGDLSLYEQHARFIRDFFAKWSEYMDGNGGLPKQVLVVSGPPGSGKTRSIEIISRKYGFRLVELENDPNFAQNLGNITTSARENTGQVPAAMESYTRHGITRPYFTDSNGRIVWDSRPACVHLDFVDGLTGADAHRFARTITNAVKLSKRPIVIVTNNRFNPAVLELGQRFFSQVAIFKRPSPTDLRKAINSLGAKFDVKIPREKLDLVLEVCECDIRASLTALQFSFVHSVSASYGAATATQLLNDKQPEPNLEWLADLDLRKLHDRVFDYSLETDVCWDMTKLGDIAEWNTLCDFTSKADIADDYERATLIKYRQLFKSGKKFPLRAFKSTYEKRQQCSDLVNKLHYESNVNIQRHYSKRKMLLELIPIMMNMCDFSRSPKQEVLRELAVLLRDIGVKSITKGPETLKVLPDLTVFQDIRLPTEIVSTFEALVEESKPFTRLSSTRPHTNQRSSNNWLKNLEDPLTSTPAVKAGVWLDFKVSDENQAKRSIGLADLFA